MKKRLLTWLLFLPFAAIHSQNISIKGRVIEQSGAAQVPVAYATVALLKEDSTLVSGVACGQDGKFSVEKVSPGDYLLVVSYVGYNTVGMELKNLSRSLDVGDLLLSESAVELEGVTVSASSVINKVDRKIIFPNQMEVNSSMNGVDLLANMNLSGLDVNRIDNSISGVRGGEVNLRINGAPASVKEVMAINPKDVIRIEHHDEPSLRYGRVEAVVDYIVRKKETGGSVMVSASHSPTTRWAEDFGSLKVNHRKSEFAVGYDYLSRGYNKSYRTNEEVYNFEDGTSLIRFEDGYPVKYRLTNHNLRAIYTLLEVDKYIFTAKFSYNKSDVPRDNSRSLLYEQGKRDQGVEMTDFNNSYSKKPSVDLYYQHNLKYKQLLAFNLVGTYTETSSERTYRETREGEILTDIFSGVSGDKYSIIGEGVYEKGFSAGRLNLGIKHSQNFIDNKYTGSVVQHTDMTQSSTYFYAEWMGKVKKISYGAGIGGTRTGMNQDDEKYSDIRFSPSLLLSYQINKTMQIRYRGETRVSAPSLGDLNDVEQLIDSLQIRRGNPDLKPVTTYVNRLSFSYNKSRFRLNLDVEDVYMVDPIFESTYRENGKFIRMMENQTKWHNIKAIAFLNVKVWENYLTWSGRGGLDWYENSGKEFSHVMRTWFINTSLQGLWKNWSLQTGLATRRNYLQGEIFRTGENNIYGGLGYKWKNLQIMGIVLGSFGESWITKRENKSHYASSKIHTYIPESKGMCILRASWNLDFGRKYKSAQQKLNNKDLDSGIMQVDR